MDITNVSFKAEWASVSTPNVKATVTIPKKYRLALDQKIRVVIEDRIRQHLEAAAR